MEHLICEYLSQSCDFVASFRYSVSGYIVAVMHKIDHVIDIWWYTDQEIMLYSKICILADGVNACFLVMFSLAP